MPPAGFLTQWLNSCLSIRLFEADSSLAGSSEPVVPPAVADGPVKEHYRQLETRGLSVAATMQRRPTTGLRLNQGTEMGRQVVVVLYVVAMAAVIVGVDFLFFRNRFWERLTVNIGIVLVFAAFYLRFLRRP